MEPNMPWGGGGLLLPLRKLAKIAVSFGENISCLAKCSQGPNSKQFDIQSTSLANTVSTAAGNYFRTDVRRHMHKQNCNTLLSGSKRSGQPITDIMKKGYQT
jgi:hypothetical protein